MTILIPICVSVMTLAVTIMLTTIFTLLNENREYEIENTELKIALTAEQMKSKLYQDLLDEAIKEDK